MEKMKAVSPYQLFSIMFISTVFSSMMYSEYISSDTDLLSYSAAAIAALLCLCVLALPFICFMKQSENANIIKCVQCKKPTLSGIFSLLYAIYFMYSAVVSITVFALLLSNFINPGISFFAFFAAVLLCCYYSAFKGITAISRTCTVFFVLTVASLIFIGASLLPKINTLNYTNAFLFDGSALAGGALPLIAQSSGLPALFMITHRIKSVSKKPVYLWIIVSYAVIFALSLISYGVLGEYLHLTPFPFYTATQLTEIGAFQRLDVVFLSLWTVGLFVNVSLSVFALRETVQSTFRADTVKYLNPASAALIGIIALIAVNYEAVRNFIFNTGVMAAAFLLTAVILPIIVILLNKGKKISVKTAKISTAVILVLLVIPLFAGCENVQLQERLLIKGIGIDGEQGDYIVTVQYVDSYSSEDSGQSNKAVQVQGETVAQAVAQIKNTTGSSPFLGQNVGIVVGWETAEDDMQQLLDYFVRYCDSRPTVKLFLSRTTAEDILTLEADGTLIPIDQISNISLTEKGGENLFTVLNFMEQSKSRLDTPVASVLKADENNVSLDSVAVFSPKGIYSLDREELSSFQLVNGIAKGDVLSFSGVSCEVNECGAYVSSKDENGGLIFSAGSDVTLNILENPDNISDEEIIKLFESEIKNMVLKSMKHTVNEMQSDIYSLGKNLRMNDYKVYSSSENYEEKLSESVISVNIKCKITNITG